MFDYVDEIINAFDKAEPKQGGTKSSAAPDNLFKVDDREKLMPEQAVEFHNLQPTSECHLLQAPQLRNILRSPK
jgi:hypothetical protein